MLKSSKYAAAFKNLVRETSLFTNDEQ